MKVKNYSELRKHLSETMDEVSEDHSPVVITRNSKKPVVMISLEDFNSYEETIHLMRSPKNLARLITSVEEVKKGNFQNRDLIEE